MSAMWNEHCSYKSSRLHLRGLPTRGALGDTGAGRERRRGGHRRRAGLRVQDGEPQPPVLHRALPGRRDGRRRHPARRLHHGGAPHRLPRRAALRLGRPPQDPPPRRRRRGGHRRLRQFLRGADGRRLDRLRRQLRRQHPRQRHGGGPRAHRRHLLFQGDGRREAHRVPRLEDGPRRHRRRRHGVGGLRRRRAGQAPDRAGRRSFRGKSCCWRPASS